MGIKEWLLRLIGISPEQLERTRVERERAARMRGGRTGTPPHAPPQPPPEQVERTLDLDPGSFAPISDAELARRAARLPARFSSPWFGRRDLIPPADDAR